MFRVVLLLIIAAFITRVHCQRVTLLDSRSSYLTYDGIKIDPGSTIILRLRTAQLNATVLYMQGSNDTFVYVHLVNGRMGLTANDDEGIITTVQLPEPHNTNLWVTVELMFDEGMIELMSDGRDSVTVDTNGQFVSPIFVGGIPDPPPFSIISSKAMNNNHFVGCFRVLRVNEGNTTTNHDATDRSSDVMGGCDGGCSSLDCSLDPNSNGECIEYYTHGVCDCSSFADLDGAGCNETAPHVTVDGNSYSCYTLPQYDSPFVETETIIAHVRDAPQTGILMTGQQEDYKFSLYFAQQKLYYEASRNNIAIVYISTTMDIRYGTVEVRRTVDNVVIVVNQYTLAMENIVEEDFGFVRFTEICVGGGLLIYSGILQNVYYNHYYLSGGGGVYNERNVSKVKRVNFDDNNALIVLPGSLEDYTNIELSFRTSQDNAILLQCEEGSDHFHISINNSRLYASLVVGDQTRTSSCNMVNITNTNWYKLVAEPLLGSDAGNEVLLTLFTPPDNRNPSDRCDLRTSLISNFHSTPVVIGGMAGGVSSLMGCLESMLNMQQVNFDVVLSDTIHTGDCEPCDISPSPCLNGGTCNNVDDYSFNCSCVDPYFGNFCEQLEIIISGWYQIFGNNVQVFFNSTLPVKFQCELDNNAPATCVSGYVFRNVSVGKHRIKLIARLLSDPKTKKVLKLKHFTIQGPTTTPSPPQVTTSTNVINGCSVRLSFSADVDATFRCRVNGGSWKTCSDGHVVSDLPPTINKIEIEASAIQDPRAKTVVTTTINLMGQACSVLEVNYPVCSPMVVGNNFTFTFNANKPEVEYLCSLNNKQPTSCNEGSVTYSNLKKNKEQLLTVTASTCNGETVSKNFTFTPRFNSRFCKVYLCGDSVVTSGNLATATFLCDDPDATFKCKLNGKKIRQCNSPLQLNDLSPGTYTLEIKPKCASKASGSKFSTTFSIQ